VAEDLAAGTEMRCVITEDDSEFSLRAVETAPLGHKIALADLQPGDTAFKYGEDIGKITAPVSKGGHVHVHNLKTKRW
ncbi:MAG: UxaA family hydrolase, partial [Gammaproteobacteria bacterium]